MGDRARGGVRAWTAAVVAAVGLTGCSDALPTADVVLVDYAISAPTTLPAGPNRLEVKVEGVAHHTLTLCPSDTIGRCQGDHVRQHVVRKPADARDPSLIAEYSPQLVLGAGWDAAVEVDLEPGTYRIYCQIVNHASYGMDRLIQVEAVAG